MSIRRYLEAAKYFPADIVQSEEIISMKPFLSVMVRAGARISSEEGSSRSEYINRSLFVLRTLFILEEKKNIKGEKKSVIKTPYKIPVIDYALFYHHRSL
jgi:hypothetical protein